LGILDLLQIPAIVNVYGGGLQKPAEVESGLFHFVERVPYEWIFPKVYATIHHGGSGTTHMAAKYGCAQLIIPHISDQFLWNQVVADKQLGPKGKSIRKLNEAWFRETLTDLWENPSYKDNALSLSQKMQGEDLMGKYLRLFEQ